MLREAFPRERRDELLEFARAALSLRWLVLAALIADEALTSAAFRTPAALYVGILIYTFGLTLYAWRYPAQAARAARIGILLDTVAIGAGMHVAGRPQSFFYVGFVDAVAAGLLMARPGAATVAGVVSLLQLPPLRGSLFTPDLYAPWGVATLALQAAGQAAAVVTAHLRRRAEVNDLLAVIGHLAAAPSTPAETAGRILEDVVRFFRADSGSLMLYDPQLERLEIYAAHHLSNASQQAQPRMDEGIAGWVAQEARPMLLTPNAPKPPVPLQRSEIGSSMSIPITVGGRTLGVLNLNRAVDRSWFTLDDLDAAGLVARQGAVVLERAHNEHAVAAALQDLAAGFTAVGRALLRDPAVLWPVLLDQARHLAGAQFAILALEREDIGVLEIVAARGIGGQAALAYRPDLETAITAGRAHMSADGTRATAVCLPLPGEPKALGALALDATDPARSTDVLRAIAAYIAAAVHTARIAHRVADLGVVEERRRIAREMHDGLAQTLSDSLLQTDLSAMVAPSSPGQLAELKELRVLLERGMRELREFMSELRKEPETGGELPQALEALGKEFQRRTDTPTAVVVTGDPSRLPSAVRHAVLAIVRQALTNVRTHAQATALTIRAETTDAACTASVTDNGVGFDLAAHRARPPASHHLGLTSMEERAALVGGRLRITTAPGRGTTVTVHIPLGG